MGRTDATEKREVVTEIVPGAFDAAPGSLGYGAGYYGAGYGAMDGMNGFHAFIDVVKKKGQKALLFILNFFVP